MVMFPCPIPRQICFFVMVHLDVPLCCIALMSAAVPANAAHRLGAHLRELEAKNKNAAAAAPKTATATKGEGEGGKKPSKQQASGGGKTSSSSRGGAGKASGGGDDAKKSDKGAGSKVGRLLEVSAPC